MSSWTFALSSRRLPGRLLSISGSWTRLRGRVSFKTRSAAPSKSDFTEHPCCAAAAFSRRYRGSGMSTVVRMPSAYHKYVWRGRGRQSKAPGGRRRRGRLLRPTPRCLYHGSFKRNPFPWRYIMPRLTSICLASAALAVTLCAQGRGRGAATPTGPVGDFFTYNPAAKEAAEIPVGPPVVTQHKITVHGETIDYTARVGMMPIHNATTGVIEGYLNYTYYSKDGVSDKTSRAITYLYNGRPGSGTIWLHMGAFGPRKIALDPNGLSKPPYAVEDNPE